MELVYNKIISAIADTITAILGFQKLIGNQKEDKKIILIAIISLENAIRKTIDHIEDDENSKYSNKEIADLWKETGEKVSLVPELSRNAYYIFQKEMYWRQGQSKKIINNKDKVTFKAMLLLLESLRDKL